MSSAEILPFRGAPIPPAPLHPPSIIPPPLARSRSDIGLAEIARRLRYEGFAERTVIEKLRALHSYSGFPAPKNPRIRKGVPVTGARAIVARSLWDRAEVDDWFDDRVPPATVAAHRAERIARQRSDMAQRAEMIADQGRIAARKRASA